MDERPSFDVRTALKRVTMMAVVAAAMLLPAAPALATWNNPHVHVSGHIDCGGIDSARWMWWWTSSGERGWANLSAWTGVSRWVWVIREFRVISVQTYNLDLWNVPRSGTTFSYTIGCGNQWLGNTGPFTQSFGVNRPTFGSSATRHICWRAALGCWV